MENYNQRFYIEPYVHINCQKEKAILYNTYTNDLVITENIELINTLSKSLKSINAVFLVTENIYNELEGLKKRFFGDFITCDNKDVPVIITGDFIKVVKDKEFILNPEKRITGNVMSHNLFCLDIYLDNAKDTSNNINNQCLILNSRSELSIKENLKDLFGNLDAYKNLETINFFLSDAENLKFAYSLIAGLNVKYSINLNIRPAVLNKLNTVNLEILEDVKLHLLVNEVKQFNGIKISIGNKQLGLQIFVKEEQDIDYLDNYDLDHNDIELAVLYNGENESFFKKIVYTREEDLFEDKIAMQTIHKNSLLNENDFGRLIITADGLIYTNLFCNPLGDLKTENFNKILRKSYDSNYSSWFNVRSEASECKKCVYNSLCPPIGNIERLFKKNNLCFVKS